MSSEKIKIIRLKNNPVKKRARRRPTTTVKRRRPAAKLSKARRARPATVRNCWVVEVMNEKNKLYRFRYWDGRKLTTNRRGAQRYNSETLAASAARKIIAALPAAYRFARAVPA